MTTAVAATTLTLAYGESGVVPVPEGRIVLTSEGPRNLQVIRLIPHDGSAPHDLAVFVPGALDTASMLTVALAALAAWR
jgi:hypothetical protein